MRIRVIAVAATVLIACVLVGCTTVRQVDRGEVDELVSPPPPDWAVRNALVIPKGDEFTYFVGISQEQATSEEEAIQQAYLDGVRRVADSIGVWLNGVDSLDSSEETETENGWPHRIKALHVARRWDREGEGEWKDTARDALVRDQIVAMAQIVDTWVVRETFNNAPPQLNLMKYGELWKAKVLIRIPSQELEKRAKFEMEIRKREVEVQFLPVKTQHPTFCFFTKDYLCKQDPKSRPRGTHFTSYGPTDVPIFTHDHHEKTERTVHSARGACGPAAAAAPAPAQSKAKHK